MKGSKFDIEEYLMKLQCAKCEPKKYKTPNYSKTRHCIFSQDPVQDDLIWRSVVRGEATAAQRRKHDYAATQTLCQLSTSSQSRKSSFPSTSPSSDGRGRREGPKDAFMQRLEQSYTHATQGPSLPPTSSAYIGWRSSVPDLRLERYGAYT
ncbi:uncharacterized protein LOC121861402 [Homarus americanus]|uniref:uncharacterized protein LOC121861402 n=1 Tax=Homarus americanus TaxID=6706 RepID=UPI001C46315B|nr:uncharacterized protein LOC121861402 [Homarus americanus]XP_042215016.1 uncharacterized protein LOC121861402 [Homarus americanus]XP_042215017.1 uncharacterized protein LOC121861402 [Homarus americanus]